MSRIPVVVQGHASDPPPGIDELSAQAELRHAVDAADLADALEGAEVLFVWEPDRRAMETAWARATSLRWIQSSFAGVDEVLFPQLIESEVVLSNARGIFDEAMAEYAAGLLVALAKNLPGTLARQRERLWEHRHTEGLADSRLVVAGAGPIGRAIGRIGRAFGMRVSAVARSGRAGDEVFDEVAGVERLHEAVSEADYVVNALPLTGETRRLFDAAVFARMKPTARFVNVGRGATVDEEALVDALRGGGIAGAALDVFEEEPLPQGSLLWDLPNVIVSPHMSGDFHGYERAVVDLFVDNFARWRNGEPLLNVVDKRLGYPPSG